ncbi:fungal-specific transcription factor domain-containing protein [Mycena galericulata]|nr:fungal-specific transcription factor domain-containing protein [Mycena galericulata]
MSTDVDSEGQIPSLAKRKGRPCDMCRRRKRRCDGGDRCGRCVTHNFACTYLQPAAARAVSFHGSTQNSDSDGGDYIENLLGQLEVAETTLQQTLAQEPAVIEHIHRLMKPFLPPHPDDSEFTDIAESFRALSLEGPPPDPGFQGKSSAAMLVRAAVSVKSDQPRQSHSFYRDTKPWALKPWEDHPSVVHYTFPENNLMASLVSLYFSNVNMFIPLLHRPTFVQCINEGLHMHHSGFAATVLLVCAVGSLYGPGTDASYVSEEGRGREWYNQVTLSGHALRQQPTLYDLQAYCLAAEFLSWASTPRNCWSIIGFGMRVAHDIGAHRETIRMSSRTSEKELEKRACWTLLFLDCEMSAHLGRIPYFNPPEFDISLPTECDDEYWEETRPGCQPSTAPSTITFFTTLIDLYRIFNFIIRMVYSPITYRVLIYIEDLPGVVAELDSTLAKWLSNIPAHLAWNPDRVDTVFGRQSAALHCFYYYTRIMLHRPYLPAMRPATQTGLHAQDICNTAARECILIADTHRGLHLDTPLLFSQRPIFIAAMVLLLDRWGPSVIPTGATQHLMHIHTAIDVLKAQQKHWQSSAFYVEVLERLLSIDHFPTAQSDAFEALQYDLDCFSGNSGDSVPSESIGEGPSHASCPGPGVTSTQAQKSPPESDVGNGIPPHTFAIPLAFVGDEEIGATRFRRPRSI